MPSWAIYGNERRRGIPTPSGIQTPDEIFGADLWTWYDASVGTTGTNPVTAWADQGASGLRDLSQSGVGGSPNLNATGANGQPALDCVASETTTLYGQGTNFNLASETDIAIFEVTSMSSDTGNFGRTFGYAPDTSSSDFDADGFTGLTRTGTTEAVELKGAGSVSITYNTLYRFAQICSGGSASSYINNVHQGTGAATLTIGGGTTTENICVCSGASGGAGLLYWDGFVAEHIIVLGTVSADQRNAIDAYFVDKYGF
jgi:hypothetical protein